MNIQIEAGRLSGPSALVDDYYAGDPALAPFFAGSPWDSQAYRRVLAGVDHRFNAERRAAIVEAIRPTSKAAEAFLPRIADGNAIVVTTGQQAGILTGPLYTVYKAITAVKLASALEPVLDRPVAPLFWIASEDHDWNEVNHIHVVDGRNRLRRIGMEADDAPPHSMARRVLTGDIEQIIDSLAEVTPDTDFSTELFTSIRDAYQPGRTVAEAFGDLAANFFGRFGLLLADAAHPVIKRRSAAILQRELDRSAEHGRALAEQTARLEARGYEAQVPVLEGATNVFHEGEDGRERLLLADDGWTGRRSGRSFDAEAVQEQFEADPGRFSPNVFLRPIVEASLFPTVAYVAGPGELAYYAQIGCLYRAHDVDMPLIFPRFGVTLIESKVRKVLDKFDLETEDFRPPIQEIAARVLREEIPDEVDRALRGFRAALNEHADRLAEAAQGVDSTLRGPVYGARNTAHIELNELEKKIVKRLKAQDDIALRQLEKAKANLFPDGVAQERSLNVVPYLVRYGPDLLDRVADQVRVEIGAAVPTWAGVRCDG